MDSTDDPRQLGIFILDDHELFRIGLRSLLESEGMKVIGESSSARDATRRIPALRPDVAVLDGRLGDGKGIEVCRHIRSVDPAIGCLILTGHDNDEEVLLDAVRAGAAGYLLKSADSAALARAVRTAAAGESLFSDAERHSAAEGTAEEPDDPRLDRLTAQQRRVLALVAEGLTNRQVAWELHLTEKTVKNYVTIILAALGFQRRIQAAVYVARADDGRPPLDRAPS